MKRYGLVFDRDAQEEALAAAEYIARDAPMNAARWYAGLEKAIESLRSMPQRCGRAPESEMIGTDIRHYIYKSHRIIFRIEEKTETVRVLHVRHGARRALGEVEDD